MVYIDAVHYESDSYGNERIAKLKWTNNLSQEATSECTKKQMIGIVKKCAVIEYPKSEIGIYQAA